MYIGISLKETLKSCMAIKKVNCFKSCNTKMFSQNKGYCSKNAT